MCSSDLNHAELEKLNDQLEAIGHHIQLLKEEARAEKENVAVFPQCYAAVVDKIPTMAKKTLIVDIMHSNGKGTES